MKIRFFALVAALAIPGSSPFAHAQITARTLEGIQDINADGSVNLTFQMAFDARPWDLWKANIGNDPARLRAVMRHQFSAYVIDDFKFEKDDLNRTAKLTMHSPAGPELRKDQRFQVPVDGWSRLISHTAREWFFSGNNPMAGNNLNTLKIILPANTIEAAVINAGTPDQALVYSLRAPIATSRIIAWTGAGVMTVGFVLLVLALFWQRPSSLPPVQPAGHLRSSA